MDTGSFIKLAYPKLVEATNDPLAPIKLQSAHGSASSVGKMLAQIADKDKSQGYIDKLLSAWPNDEVNTICDDPSFVLALANLFCQSLVEFTRKTTKGS